MNKDLVRTVMEFIRRDGPADAPVCFLTIEDGGAFFPSDQNKTQEYFKRVLTQDDGAWVPKSEKDIAEKLGKPGNIIPPIMQTLQTGSLEGYSDYRWKSIYLKNEANLKFYPLGRQKQSTWYPEFTEYMGIDHEDYMELCQLARPRVLMEKYANSLLDGERLYIILASYFEWANTLTYMHTQHNLPVDFFSTEVDKENHFKIYFKENGDIAFAYINMFRRGLSNANLEAFASRLRLLKPEISNLILNK